MVYMKRNATTFLYGCFQLRYTYQCRHEGRDPLRFLATYFRSAKKFFRSESAQIPLPAYGERQYVLRYTIFHYDGNNIKVLWTSLAKFVQQDQPWTNTVIEFRFVPSAAALVMTGRCGMSRSAASVPSMGNQ